MAITKNVKISVHSRIANLDGGDTEVADLTYRGTLTANPSGATVHYVEDSEGGKIFCEITSERDKLTVRKNGAICSVMVFEQGRSHESIYEIPPFRFSMTVTTRGLKNSISLFGGVADILYSMDVGGAKKSCRMKITVSE